MSNASYTATASILEKQPVDENGKPIKGAPIVDLSNIPIRSFSVVGGASRSINLDSTDDISISSEFEQARTYHNVTLFIPPTKDFTAVILFTLKSPITKFFALVFHVEIFSGGKMTHSLVLQSYNAWLRKNPTPVGNKEALLMLEVQFDKVQLLHGKVEDGFNHAEM